MSGYPARLGHIPHQVSSYLRKRQVSIRWDHLDRYCFVFFLFVLPFSIRKVLWYVPLRGGFNEYASFSVYLSDLALVATLILWLIQRIYSGWHRGYPQNIHENAVAKKCPGLSHPPFGERLGKTLKGFFSHLSTFSTGWHEMFHVKHISGKMFPRETYARKIQGYGLVAFVFFIIWSFASLTWSNYPWIAFSRLIRIFEGFLLFLYISSEIFAPRETAPLKNIPRGTIEVTKSSMWNNPGTTILKIFIIDGTLQSIVAIIQFITQSSLGLSFLWESALGKNLPGVAKIVIGGEKYIRGYGLLPHPNILGGFLMVTLWISIWMFLFHMKQEHQENFHGKQHFWEKYSTWNNFLILSLGIQGIGLFITFSKSAWIGFVISMVLAIILDRRSPDALTKWSGCSTGNIVLKRVFHGKQSAIIYGAILILLGGASIVGSLDKQLFLFQSLNERSVFQEISWGMVQQRPTIGWGVGQFVPHISSIPTLEFWQLQPVHNTFLLITTELGTIGLSLFLIFLGSLLLGKSGYVSRETCTSLPLEALLLGILFILFFDHYFWDIQQGFLLFWIILGLVFIRTAGQTVRHTQTSLPH